MTSALSRSFGQQLDALAQHLGAQWVWPSPSAGFVLYACKSASVEMPVDRAPSALSAEYVRRMDQAPILAAAGYSLALGEEFDDATAAAWGVGLSRLASRHAFPADRNSFFYRPTELLGIVLGAAQLAVDRVEDVAWLRRVLKEGEGKLAVGDLWGWVLTAKAADLLSVSWQPLSLPSLDTLDLLDLALLAWLQNADDTVVQLLRSAPTGRTINMELLKRCAVTERLPRDPAQAAVLYCALRIAVLQTIESDYAQEWQVGQDVRDATILIATLCSRFHVFARQLLPRYGQRATLVIKDEYDVQDLMHALLRIHFSDVRAEEWTPSYAGSSSRMDFLLKPERVIIETKMTRQNLGDKGVANELIIDKERYRAHPDCGTLICFIYDPDGRLGNPVALETDLASKPGDDLHVRVIVAPKGA